MGRRILSLVVVTFFAYWASGLGQCLHEEFEHHHDAAEAVASPTGKDKPSPLHEADDHDDCLVCQTVKVMVAHSPDGVTVPEPSLPAMQAPAPPLPDAPVICTPAIHLARAPPATPASA
jgi:hypothetical protein